MRAINTLQISSLQKTKTNAASDLILFGTIQLLRFEKCAHGNCSGGILITTYYKLPTPGGLDLTGWL